MNPARHATRPNCLWILDIDGTLMPSQHIDNECYWRAVFEYFGETPRTLDLHQFEHVTDGRILGEWMQQTHGREPTVEEVAGIRKRFLDLTRSAFESEPQAFAATPGLTGWLDQQLAEHGPCIAIATGGWGHTARFKLQAAGLEGCELPLASSDDGNNRCEIMRYARRMLLKSTEPDAADNSALSTCYIGDGLWDFLASRELGWDFIGMAAGEQAEKLRQAGAEQVFCNFNELAASKAISTTARKYPRNAPAQ